MGCARLWPRAWFHASFPERLKAVETSRESVRDVLQQHPGCKKEGISPIGSESPIPQIAESAIARGCTGRVCKCLILWSGLSESNRHLNLGKSAVRNDKKSFSYQRKFRYRRNQEFGEAAWEANCSSEEARDSARVRRGARSKRKSSPAQSKMSSKRPR